MVAPPVRAPPFQSERPNARDRTARKAMALPRRGAWVLAGRFNSGLR